MPLSTITHYSATTVGGIPPGLAANGRRRELLVQNLDAANDLRLYLLGEVDAGKDTPAPGDAALGYITLGPGVARSWSGPSCPENAIFLAGATDTVVAAVELKLEA